MWTYEQRTGHLYDHDGELIGTGYSGAGPGKNNHEVQAQHEVGPIPVGIYTIGAPTALDGGPHGPYVIPLTPDAGNEMFERSAFLMHGDSIKKPGTASKGCIIQARKVRVQVWESGDHRLEVVNTTPVAT